MKRFLSALLSFTITFASLPAAAEDRKDPFYERRDDVIASIVAQHIGGDENFVEGTQVVAEFDASDEVRVAKELSGLGNVTYMIGKDDPVERVLDGEKDMIVQAESQADIPILNEETLRSFLSIGHDARADRIAKVKASIAKHAKQRMELLSHRAEVHRKKVAVLVSVFAGSTYGVYYFLLTSSALRATGTAFEGFFTYLGVSLFSKQWISFSRYGVGNTFAWSALALTRLIGKPIGKRSQVYFRRFGQLFTAFGLSVISTSLMMTTAGQIRNPGDSLTMFANSLFASHDSLDIKARQSKGEKFAELISPLRIFSCMILEALAMGGHHWAEFTVVGLIGLFSTMFMFREYGWAKRKIKEKFQNLGPTRWLYAKFKKKEPCNEILEKNNTMDDNNF